MNLILNIKIFNKIYIFINFFFNENGRTRIGKNKNKLKLLRKGVIY